MAIDKKYGKVTVEHDSERNPINESDEPIFVLRSQDALALQTLNFYRKGLPLERRTAMVEVIEAFDEFAQANPDRVKIPD